MSDDRGSRSAAVAEFIIPVGAIAFTVYYIVSVSEGPFEAKFSAYFVGTALLAACTLFVVTRIWRLSQGRLPKGPPQGPPTMAVQIQRVVLLLLVLGYVLMIDNGAGFTIANFVFLTAAISLLAGLSHPLRIVGVSALLSVAGYLLFIVAFDTRFPEGPFEKAMTSLFS